MSVQKGIIVPCNVIWVIKSRPLRTLQVSSNFNVSLYYNHTIDIREIHKLSLLMYVFNFGIIRYSRMQGKWFLFVLLKKNYRYKEDLFKTQNLKFSTYRSIRFN